MKLIDLFQVTISLPLQILIPFLGINFPTVATSDAASDKQRFDEVAGQLDLGGVLYGYISVDGDLSGLAKFANSFMSGMKEIDKGVPDVDVEALMKISGLDSISALGLSSIQTNQGFRNKVYLHAPNGVRGLLSMFGDEAKEFEVLQLAPSGTDFVVQQEVKLKTFYNEVVLGALGGSPEQGGAMPLGPQGMMMKMMVDGIMKQPMPPPFTFTGEKLINDLDTKIMVIIDGDPSKKLPVRLEGNDLNMPKIQGAVLIDNVGWLVGNLIKMFEAEKAKGGKRVPPFEVIDHANWEGLKFSIESESLSKRDRKEIKQFGLQNAMLAHHRPSGKLILSSSKEFATGLFSKKPKLASDPVFLAKTKGLPKQGTAISYLSPVLMTELRKFIKEAIEAENPPEKEYQRDDRFVALSMLDFFLPEGALGEAMVTTVTEDGLLSVGNSAYSHKSKILMGAAVPTLVGVGMFTAVRQVDRMFEPAEAFEDLEAPKAVPHKHEIKVIPSERSNGGD
jgi:hypothetical protein